MRHHIHKNRMDGNKMINSITMVAADICCFRLNDRVKLPITHSVRDGNVDKTLKDYRAELVHDLYHWFVIILQVTKH